MQPGEIDAPEGTGVLFYGFERRLSLSFCFSNGKLNDPALANAATGSVQESGV